MDGRDTITAGMTVLDREGEKVGTVARIYRERPESSEHSMTYRGEPRFGTGFLEVDGGVAGIGTNLYVPFSEILDLDERGVYLNAHKDAVGNRQWDLRPVALDEPQWEASETSG